MLPFGLLRHIQWFFRQKSRSNLSRWMNVRFGSKADTESWPRGGPDGNDLERQLLARNIRRATANASILRGRDDNIALCATSTSWFGY